jgi:hypothetical protein
MDQKTELKCPLAQHRFPIIFVSSVCPLVCVTMADNSQAVTCCLLATSAVMLSKKKKRNHKMWSKGCLSFIHFVRLSALR